MPTEFDDLRRAFEHQIGLFDFFLPASRGDAGADSGVRLFTDEPKVATVVEADRPIADGAEFGPPAAPEPEPPFETPAVLEPVPRTESRTMQNPYLRIAARIPEDSPLHGMETLAEVEQFVADTVLIPLDETRTNPVFGVGNTDADLMVIGEAPGADEDRLGEPFVGRAGKLLNQILEAIGFARSDVYIANILKSRPPGNRNPEAHEVAAHLPLLHKQITLIRPKLILCVGKTSGTSLLGIQSSLKDMRGTFHDYHGLPVLVTYHPAALLRNPNWKRPTWDDVKILRKRYDELVGSGSTSDA